MASHHFPESGEILGGLSQQPGYELNSERFELVKEYVILLPEVAAANMFTPEQPLDVFTLLTMQSAFMREAFKRGLVLPGGFGNSVALDVLNQQDSMLPEFREQVEAGTINPDDVMLGESAQLNEQLRQMYQAGTLRLADAMRLQPTVFMTH